VDFEGLEEVIAYEGKQFVTDLEGPITRNDNALELCEKYLERGARFFALISRYDDVLADVLHRSGYKADDKLRLMLPFLKAHGATDHAVLEFSKQHVAILPGADKAMRFIPELMASFIVSTSYEHYVSAVCDRLDFPFENVFCTRVSLDQTHMEDWEAKNIQTMAEEIAAMPLIDIPAGAKTLKDFTSRDQKTILRLDEIFWTEITDLPSFRLVMEVNPIGGEEKAAAIVDICKKTGIGIEDTMYVGDSTTDVQALRMVKRGGGLAVAFNGNSHAVREADLAVLSENAVVMSVLAETFFRGGKDASLELVDHWDAVGIKRSGVVHDYLVKELERTFPDGLPRVERVTTRNLEDLISRSTRFRRTINGEAVESVG
jgi:energy-converting hydrogenase A subunit R